jgi:hypothetical protein
MNNQFISKEKRIAFFEENFDLISYGSYGTGKKIYIGDKNKRKCRFCGKSKPEVTFKNIAHAIPEFFGNKQLILIDECDNCNKFISENLETHLDKYTRPYRTIAFIPGKRGVPSYKSADKQSRVDVGNSIEISTRFDSGFFNLCEDDNEIKIEFNKEPYIPVAVYKALCKIAIGIILDPNELPAFEITKKWLLCPDHSKGLMQPLMIFITFVPGPKPFHKINTFLFRKKSSTKNIHAIFVIGFGNFLFQLIVPSHFDLQLGKELELSLPHFPIPFIENKKYGDVMYAFLDFSSHEKKIEKFPITFKYEYLKRGS